MEAFVSCPKEFEDLIIAGLSPPLQALVERIGFTWRQSEELATSFVQHKAHGTGGRIDLAKTGDGREEP